MLRHKPRISILDHPVHSTVKVGKRTVFLFLVQSFSSSSMASKIEPLLLLLFLPTIFSASFPLTAISHYSELAPCAASHVSVILDESIFDGCSSNTPISVYGSCLCAQRLSWVQSDISVDFGVYDPECSLTAVQPYLTAFCGQWGVDIGAAEKAKPSTTTTLGGSLAGPTGGGMCFDAHRVTSETNGCSSM